MLKANKAVLGKPLGKRVDYSGRSVIVIGPNLNYAIAVSQRKWHLFYLSHLLFAD